MTLKQAIHQAAQRVARTTLTVAIYKYDDERDYWCREWASNNSWLDGPTEICRVSGWADHSLTIKDAEMILRQEAGII